MPRFARLVIPEIPHHMVNRGNHQHDVFLMESDKLLYLKLLEECGRIFGISYLAYCLMDNHIHLITIPQAKDSFAKGFGEANRKYSVIVNSRESWNGNMWQGRFKSYPMDDSYLYAAVRYVERNPVRAGLVTHAMDYPWSSARTHVSGGKNPILILSDCRKLLAIEDWRLYLDSEEDPGVLVDFDRHERTGRPLGSIEFIKKLEALSGRRLMALMPGRKKQADIPIPSAL